MSASVSLNVHIKLPVPRKLYLAARAKRHGTTLSFNAYMIGLICKDCGLDLESLQYETRPRTEWPGVAEEKENYDALLVMPRVLHETMRKKLDEQPYPVVTRGYLRTLIENDVRAGG